jgi:hypothetical protein
MPSLMTQRCDWVSPPPSKQCVECKSDKQDNREVSANITLKPIGLGKKRYDVRSERDLSDSNESPGEAALMNPVRVNLFHQ